MNCKGVFQVLQRVILKSMARVVRVLIIGTIAAGTLWVALPHFALAGPDPVDVVENTATANGNQSAGISIDSGSYDPPVTVLDVNNLSGNIEPGSGTNGINFISTSGGDVTTNSGDGGANVVISTEGNNASGIVAESQGTPPAAPNDPFLGIPIPGDPAVSGGIVQVHSYSDITTNGNAAHGIAGRSSTTGYPKSVVNQLEAFSSAGISFTVTSVENQKADGNPGVVGEPVQGLLIDADGNPVAGSGGTFTVNSDGTYLFNRGTDFDDMAVGEERRTTVTYTLLGVNSSTGATDDPVGTVVVIVTRTEGGFEDNAREAYFDRYGVSSKPTPDPDNPGKSLTVFPDLDGYVQGLLADAAAGGMGNSVSVTSSGTIHTMGDYSHGILAQSQGGMGGYGSGGSISHSAGAGGDGKSGGHVTVTADGTITTDGNYSVGILADSVGGNGGHGGNGGFWRYGARGGTGGNGGEVTVNGSATIITNGDYSSGILALSEGGNGGDGGSGKVFTGGGNGGYGGQGGAVNVEGNFDITTEGVASHGIWAKSVGGDAGTGGSGGWIAGAPGGGGQATDGGSVTVASGGAIETNGSDSYGIYAQSVGGFGGRGGSATGIFYSHGGSGNSAGSGGEVTVTNQESGSIITHGDRAHAVFTQSVGGGGGSGGSGGALVGLGGTSAAGGNGGVVEVTNEGWIQTLGGIARGIYAQSIGGGGGDGGNSGGLVAIGGAGSSTSDGGAVTVTNNGTILTKGYRSHAIFAESIGGGGGDGGDSGGIITIGGSGGGGGNAGAVTIVNTGLLRTGVDENGEANSGAAEACGIFAQSVGGGGGNGGGAVSIGLALASVAIGGRGGIGGNSDKVDIINSSDGNIITAGDRSYGIYAQSVGGGGGNGGFAVSVGIPVSIVSLAIGGQAGGGGDGNEVEVHNEGTITTLGAEAHGIIAQSVGGGGGTGGFAVSGNLGGSVSLQLALGGKGGSGGMGKVVNVGTELNPIEGTINTSGQRSYGILAQSIGGGGGDGGFSIAGSGVTGTSLNLAIGGSGGGGGKGDAVNVDSISNISTKGDDAHAIVAQSIGGGGGNGGFSLAASYGGGTGLNFGFGGSGGTGNAGGSVSVGTELNPLGGTITTSGDRAYGVMAQSVGGGGGNGGSSITGQLLGGQTIAFSFGGDGGMGGLGGTVDVESASNILTLGEQSHGILAQSVGGGGGNGGLSIGAAVTAFGGLNFSMGGDGGNGNSGGTVEVNNSGIIETINEYSHGIMAQSIGGGGGTGGTSGSVMVNFSSLIPVPPEIPIKGSVNIAASVGGDGGMGGQAGSVSVNNTGEIATYDDFSIGIFSQSIGGGGGDGGKSIAATANISLPEGPSNGNGGGSSKPQMEVQVDFALAMGGDGGNGNSGGSVDVINSGAIDTFGDSSHGIFAQSIGGGGGRGGDARSMTLSIDPSNWLPSDPPPTPGSISQALNISIGGNAGSGNNGGIVTIDNEGTVITRGADAYGIFAQSIGGGGGEGGGGYHGLDWEDLGVPEDIAPFLDLAPIEENSNVQVVVGGRGGSSGNGGDVNVANDGDIITLGDGSIAVLAQSIGAGGGIGGVGAHGSGTVGIGGSGGAAGNGGNVDIEISGNIDTDGVAAHGIFAQSIGGGGGIAGNVDGGIEDFGLSLNIGVGQNGGNAGDGGGVTVTSAGNITTRGVGSNGIFAQSIGGGGGLAGDISTGLGFAGSVGGSGSGGDITIMHNGNITTFGDNSHGIFAQSAGGKNDSVSQQLGLMDTFGNLLRDPFGGIIFGPLIPLADSPDLGGEIDITVDGDVMVFGDGSHAIFAQSIGDDGNGDITVTVSSGTVQGGFGSGAGIYIDGGADNVLTNSGSISAFSGTAIAAGIGNETIDNYGTVTGDVNLGAGSNAFNNLVAGTFNAGAAVNLNGGTLFNAGMFSPGGSGIVLTTGLNGNLMQAGSGTYAVDLDFDGDMIDLLNVSGTAGLEGTAYINILNAGWSTPGTQQFTILSGAGGVSDSGLSLDFQPSAVITYDLLYPNTTDVMLSTSVDFCPPSAGLNANQTAIANAVNAIQLAGGSASFAPFADALFRTPDYQSLASAYDQMSPDSYDIYTKITSVITQQYTQTLLKRIHSIRSPLRLAGSASKYADRDQILLAYNGSDASIGRLIGTSELTPEKATYGVWLDPFGKWGDQDEVDGFNGYQYNVYGATLGLDRTFGTRFVAGIGIGYSYTDIGLERAQGKGDINTIFSALYGSYFTRRMYVDVALSYGRQSYDNERNIVIGPLQNTASSDHSGDTYSAFAEGGYNIDIKNWIIQPFVSLHYIYLDEESFSESGAGGGSLRVESRQTDSLVSELGARITRVFRIKNSSLIPEISAAWNYDFGIDDRMITASFAGAPGTSFSVRGQDVEPHGAIVSAGLTFISKGGLSASLKYNGEFRENYQAHGILAGLRYEF